MLCHPLFIYFKYHLRAAVDRACTVESDAIFLFLPLQQTLYYDRKRAKYMQHSSRAELPVSGRNTCCLSGLLTHIDPITACRKASSEFTGTSSLLLVNGSEVTDSHEKGFEERAEGELTFLNFVQMSL